MTGDIQVEMILVMAVCIGAENRAKGAAGRSVNPAQNPALGSVVPAIFDFNFCPVGECKRGYINSVAFGVFADPCPAAAVSGPA